MVNKRESAFFFLDKTERDIETFNLALSNEDERDENSKCDKASNRVIQQRKKQKSCCSRDTARNSPI